MTEPQDDTQSRPDSGRLAMGVAVISLGVLLLLDRAGVIDWGTRAGWWPLLAIIFGVTRLAAGGVRAGAFWVLVGAWGLLVAYGVLQFEDSWPLLLVIAGGSMVLGSFGSSRSRATVNAGGATTAGAVTTGGTWGARLSRAERRAARRERWNGGGGPLIWIFIMFGIVMSIQGRYDVRGWDADRRRVTRTETTDTVHRAAILGQTHSVSHSSAFHGGDLTAIMGQCDLDLTQAIVAPGETPVINVFVLMGQVTVRVPDDWIVDIRAVPAIGTVGDARSTRSYRGSLGSPSSPGAGDAAAPASAERTHLVLRGAATMGELIVKD